MLLPTSNVEILKDFDIKEQPSNTYKIDQTKNRIHGFIDELDAVKQAIYLILNVERYEYLIYDWSYGFEIRDLIGQPAFSVLPEIERRIIDALMQDSRITGVSDFEFKVDRNKVTANFTIKTIYGVLDNEKQIIL